MGFPMVRANPCVSMVSPMAPDKFSKPTKSAKTAGNNAKYTPVVDPMMAANTTKWTKSVYNSTQVKLIASIHSAIAIIRAFENIVNLVIRARNIFPTISEAPTIVKRSTLFLSSIFFSAANGGRYVIICAVPRIPKKATINHI